MHPLPHRHRSRSFGIPSQRITGFPVYLVRSAEHIPDVEMMMERHRVLIHNGFAAWLEHLTIQRVAQGFMLFAKLVDASQMAHHPEYESWIRVAQPLEEALGTGWRQITQHELRELLGDAEP